MFNPLSLKKNEYIELKISQIREKELYICNNIVNFTDSQNSYAAKYQLLRTTDNKEIYLEVKKDRALNYQLFYYEIVQEMEFNPTFISLIGTSSIGYNKPDEKHAPQVVYNRIPKKGELTMPIKHIVEEAELPNNPEKNGYFKDGNGNWYFMTKKSEGNLKKFNNNIKTRSWEYKHKQNRLLIEMENQEFITIYEGREIARRDLRKVHI